MAQVTRNITSSGMSVQTKFPTIPPRPPQVASSYCRATLEAPITALMGIAVDGKQPERHPVTIRCRMRRQAGHTNRWRLPESAGSDLLGNAQAWRSINIPYNSSMIKLISSETCRASLPSAANDQYAFNKKTSRPASEAEFQQALHPAASSQKKKSVVFVKPGSAPGKSHGSRSIAKYTPPNARLTQPMDVFHYHSKRSSTGSGPAEIPTQRREREAFLLVCQEMLRTELSYRWAV